MDKTLESQGKAAGGSWVEGGTAHIEGKADLVFSTRDPMAVAMSLAQLKQMHRTLLIERGRIDTLLHAIEKLLDKVSQG